MKLNKFLKLGLISSSACFPFLAVACGNKVETTEKIKQDKTLSSEITINTIEQDWLNSTLASLYGIDISNNDNLNKLKNDVNSISSQLFNDSYLAFQLYAQNQLNKDKNFFLKKNIELVKNTDINDYSKIIATNQVTPGEIPNSSIFKAYWANDKSKIREEISKLLLVYKYFQISDPKQLKTIDSSFKYDKDLTTSIENYNLNQYALKKKLIQIWKKSDDTKISTDDFFLQGYGLIKDVNDFNNFLKNSPDYSKVLKKNSSEILTNNPYDTELKGYAGFEVDNNNYGLLWNYEDLSKINSSTTNDYSLTGFYSPSANRLFNQISKDNPYSPYKNNADTTDKAILAYINQITPIAEKLPTKLPLSENSSESEDKILLSFKNTPYADKINRLSFIFALNDPDIYKTAQNAFSKLGYQIQIKKDINETLFNALKDKSFIKIID
ncbi:HinT-interacting membrane complex lipoprotein P60 [Mycoplasmopsis meleagridis]|uniref:HinT-interacting membrane complex lipoprotein P60 n=1 Tax=Mycoplasmopsis meleagridis TaxID=29561 RepID=UPI003A8599DB